VQRSFGLVHNGAYFKAGTLSFAFGMGIVTSRPHLIEGIATATATKKISACDARLFCDVCSSHFTSIF